MKAVLDHWIEIGEWWDGDDPKEVFRVITDDGGIFELSREVEGGGPPVGPARVPVGPARAPGGWRLYKAYD